jgi:hypothetical protein
VTTEELGNLKDLFQDKMPVVRQFAKKYRQMALNGAFYVPLDYYTGKSAKYKINEPFRVGMVSEITDLHFFLYPRASCAKCVPGGEKPFEPKTTKELMNMLSKYKNQTAMISTLAFWIKTHNIQKPGVDPLEGPYKSYWNFFEKVSRANPAPWHDILEGMRAKQASRGPRTRSIRGTHITGKSDEFEQVLKKRGPGRPKLTSQEISRRRLKDAVLDPDDYNNTDSENTEKTEVETLTEFPDYDSTYVRPPNEKI